MPRHRAALDLPAESVAHHHVESLPPLLYESPYLAEIVAVIRIAHDDERPARSRNPGPQSGAISALPHSNNARAKFLSDLDGPIRRAVIRNHNFSAQSRRAKR